MEIPRRAEKYLGASSPPAFFSNAVYEARCFFSLCTHTRTRHTHKRGYRRCRSLFSSWLSFDLHCNGTAADGMQIVRESGRVVFARGFSGCAPFDFTICARASVKTLLADSVLFVRGKAILLSNISFCRWKSRGKASDVEERQHVLREFGHRMNPMALRVFSARRIRRKYSLVFSLRKKRTFPMQHR